MSIVRPALPMAFTLAIAGLACAPNAASFAAAEPPASRASAEPQVTAPVVYRVRVVARYPHDETAYTQGLLWHEGTLYESTGRVGQSVVRKVDPQTGAVLAQTAIPATHFGEGLALWNDELISLTWRNGAVHRWSLADLSLIATKRDFPFEGWGITTAPDGLIFSDGTATLRVIDPHTYAVVRELAVTLDGRSLGYLNELEWIDGRVWANVWQTGYIAIIDPVNGVVEGVVDARVLVAEINPATRDDVLNGIAWDAKDRRLFVTGKFWPTLFEITLEKTDRPPR